LIYTYNDMCGDYYEDIYISNVLNNPTFLDVLIESNKSLIKTKNYYNKYLNGLYKLDPSILYNYTGINAKKNIIYYEILMGC